MRPWARVRWQQKHIIFCFINLCRFERTHLFWGLDVLCIVEEDDLFFVINMDKNICINC